VDRLRLFPDTTTVESGSLEIAGLNLLSLAEEYRTPLYVYDRATLDNAVEAYRSELADQFPGRAEITYAGKAFLCTALAAWSHESGLWLDCTGEGEITIAAAAGVPPEHIVVHGVNKSLADLECAVHHAGTIVVDNLAELSRLGELFTLRHNNFPKLWLRVLPGLAVETHHSYTRTGQHGSKFGMIPSELIQAASFCRSNGLPLCGIHFHQGSNFWEPSPLIEAIRLVLDLANQVAFGQIWHFSPGGGWGVAYHEDELPHPGIGVYVRMIAHEVVAGCQRLGLSLPTLHLEPGRSLIARAGVALYRVGARKRRGETTWLLVDGGIADNPRHALYGAGYSALPIVGLGRAWTERVHIAGPYCESGDVLIEDLQMPVVEQGELIAIPVAGAYQLSMSSNYNGAQRPAVLWLEKGRAQLILRRESIGDLLRRDPQRSQH